MKLYATIKNENGTIVSKGGNEELFIDIAFKNKHYATIRAVVSKEGQAEIYFHDNDMPSKVYGTLLKGKSQKGEKEIEIPHTAGMRNL